MTHTQPVHNSIAAIWDTVIAEQRALIVQYNAQIAALSNIVAHADVDDVGTYEAAMDGIVEIELMIAHAERTIETQEQLRRNLIAAAMAWENGDEPH